MTIAIDDRVEWLEADGLGGFASGTSSGIRTRRYHALLLSAATPPTGRQVLVAGMDVTVERAGTTVAISSQRYMPGIVHPDGASRIESFTNEPWPVWRYRVDSDLVIEQSVLVPKGLPVTVVRWRVRDGRDGGRLVVRPFLAGRDYHATHHENSAFRFDGDRRGQIVEWRPYDGILSIRAATNGLYQPQADWYRQFVYTEELNRGLDAVEDLATPGTFAFDMSRGDAVIVLASVNEDTSSLLESCDPATLADALEVDERERRRAFINPLDRAADAYLVRRGRGSTIVAGYPWFTDWGRDTFIALRGLCLARGRYREARDILVEWASAVSAGMLPNRFPDAGDAPEFNAVDASLWFVIAAHDWLMSDPAIDPKDRAVVLDAIDAILDGYSRGTRFAIKADDDGLLAAGVPGVQLTWMDARVGDRVITPRIGKPVEIQALWINALWIGSQTSPQWIGPFETARRSFDERFWNSDLGALYDVIDVDHVKGQVDASFRPNQILAVGGLPLALVDGERARRVVDAVERRLLTPIGLRSLAPDDAAYVGHYKGSAADRDAAYHQGTVWPWLLGPFVDAWVRVHGNTDRARSEAAARFLPLLGTQDHVFGLHHLPEVADGDSPHHPGGCPFQAWSVGEVVRVERSLLPLSAPVDAVAIR